MAVAKSYEKATVIGEPYKEGGKMYINIKANCPRCGGSGHYSYDGNSTICYQCNGAKVITKTVRWYTDSQRAANFYAALIDNLM